MVKIMYNTHLHGLVMIFVAYRNNIVCTLLYICNLEMKFICEKLIVRKRINPKKNITLKNGSWITDSNTQLSNK